MGVHLVWWADAFGEIVGDGGKAAWSAAGLLQLVAFVKSCK